MKDDLLNQRILGVGLGGSSAPPGDVIQLGFADIILTSSKGLLDPSPAFVVVQQREM